ncbi:hypothetical protein ALC62_14147 [Cyphomyrmex costatus]|uniref:Uncharacterized protein n=1 Tax=Cyphomyrmex costatus TaxID=456900 RepID=A0A195C4Y3_9HYME|nr:hypothetical protein ALC62_14147 [Cyphomyrmex costatus]
MLMPYIRNYKCCEGWRAVSPIEKGRRLEVRRGVAERKDDRARKAAGALQEFTRGLVHEHVKVEPGAHRWLQSRMSSTCVNSYAHVCRGHASSDAFDSRFRNDKDSPEITKIPERVRVQTIGGTSNPGAMASFASRSTYPNGSKGHRRNREAFVVPTSSTDTRLASDVLYDHVDPGTLVIAIEAIYLDPRAK